MVWSIAGSDCSGGAGVQADLLTCHDFEVDCATVITALTAQNTQHVAMVEACSDEMFAEQLVVLAKLQPARVIKIGMLANAAQVVLLAEAIEGYKSLWQHPPFIIYDPVLRASSGFDLAAGDVFDALPQLLAVVDLMTPNADELEQLTGELIDGPHAIKRACQKLRRMGVKGVLAKGGHFEFALDYALDYYQNTEREILLNGPRIATHHHHGSGCCLSSAIAAALANDYPIDDALVLAKAYLTKGLRLARPTGFGNGCVAHTGWPTQRDAFPTIESAQTTLGQLFDLATPWPQGLEFERCVSGRLGLYPVVDSVAWVERLLNLGVKTLQLRIKQSKGEALEHAIAAAVALARRYDAQLFINDHWQLAIKHGAYGVHLGQEDLLETDLTQIAAAGLRLGVSTHGYFELLRAYQLNPSYIALGHIFPTTTKEMPSKPQGLKRLKRYAELMSDFPLVAIGGIDLGRAEAVLATGVGSLAVVRAVTEARSPEQAIRQFNQLMDAT
jgi:hydroxymethylpyrimidine kinase/phosphomethylpyrimidine kinase/thiamine-phosphate diphosphorylase